MQPAAEVLSRPSAFIYEKRGGVEEFAREGSHQALQEPLRPLHQLDL